MVHTGFLYCVRLGDSNSISSLILRWLPRLFLVVLVALMNY